MTDFALTPDHGPPRVVRFVEPGELPGSHLLCVLDKEKNLLIINRELYRRLDHMQRHQVWRTHASALALGDIRDAA